MKFSHKDNSVCYYGRWSVEADTAITTAPGAFAQIAFSGEQIVLHFDTYCMSQPNPQLWLSMDGGGYFAMAVDKHIRIQATSSGNHVVTMIFKSAKVIANRWFWPLDARVAFAGFEAEGAVSLPRRMERAIEFLGDSITEGALVDAQVEPEQDMLARPYQNDAVASFAWQTAWKLGRIPIMMGYAAVGVSQRGLGGVPQAAEMYPYCYLGTSFPGAGLDVEAVVLNYGENDRKSTPKAFVDGYLALISEVLAVHPEAKIILLQPFAGGFHRELEQIVQKVQQTWHIQAVFLPTEGWLPLDEPLHPARSTHKLLAEKLVNVLADILP